jgi:isopentenyldiphosphate isomerase
MKPLDNDSLRDLRRLRQAVGFGYDLSQADLDRLRDDWSPIVQPDRKDVSEDFAITRPDGSAIGVAGPRWVFHLVGIAHRAAHIGLVTPTGQVILQRRAQTKADWPDAWDMAVAGHVPQKAGGASMSFEEGARKEIGEELGLPESTLNSLLVEGGLIQIGPPRFTYEQDESRNPPFYNAEVVQDFGATLNAEGLSRLKPDWDELGGLYLCSPQMAWDTLVRGPAAGGLRFSLPPFLDWLEKRGGALMPK